MFKGEQINLKKNHHQWGFFIVFWAINSTKIKLFKKKQTKKATTSFFWLHKLVDLKTRSYFKKLKIMYL